MTNGAWPEHPSPRFILARLLRREQLCPGGPSQCPDVGWEEQQDADTPPCPECPRLRLDQCLQFTEAGRLVRAALELDWATKCGIQIRMEDVSYPEFLRLRMLAEERQALEAEQAERRQQNAERGGEHRNRLTRGPE